MADNIVSRVTQMRQQGLSDNEIVQNLQSEGYTSQQIFDAMSQADVYAQSQGQEQPAQQQSQQAQPPQAQPRGQGQQMPPPAQGGMEAPPQPEQQMEPPGMPSQGQTAGGSSEDINERIQAIAETIIDEKWEDLMDQMRKVLDWKEEKDKEIQALKDDMSDLKENFKEIKTNILGKVSEYDEHMKDVGSELKAIEKVFKDVVPTFTENVNELNRITKKLKGNKKSKSKKK